jgi:ABC-type multidrug transport system ATPase subunit
MAKAGIESRVEAIISFSELGDFIDVPVKTYSSGMLVRLGFAIAAHLDADILLLDEVLAVGDEGFQRKCLHHIAKRISDGVTLLFVSHDPEAIQRVCQRVVVLDAGRVVFDGSAADGLLHYERLTGDPTAVRPQAVRDQVLAVADVELRDETGRRRTLFHSGQPMQVMLTLAGRLVTERPQLVLEVFDEHGARVFRVESPPMEAAAGGVVLFEIPRLALLGGDYYLAAGAIAVGGAEPGFDRLLRFGVVPVLDAQGVADLRGSWVAVGDRAKVAS